MGFIPNLTNLPIGQHLAQASQMFSMAQPIQIETGVTFQNFMQPGPEAIGSFKDVLGNAMQGVNSTVRAPETLMKEAMSGGRVDIHDVVIASSKAELAVSLTSQTLTKVIQAYDRISQIQV